MGNRYRPGLAVLPRQPRLDRLITVLPIAQRQQASGIEILALSLEVYTAGFVVTFQAQSHGAVEFIDEPPRLALNVADNRDRQYRAVLCGATGEGARSDWQWRLTYRCFPALPRDVAVLHLLIAAMTWYMPNEERQVFLPINSEDGPWAFTVQLSPTV